MSEENYATATLQPTRLTAVVGSAFDLAGYRRLACTVREAGVQPGELALRVQDGEARDLTSVFDLMAGCLAEGLAVSLEGPVEHEVLLGRVREYVQAAGADRYRGLK